MPARRAARSVQHVDRRRLRTTAGFWRVVDLLLPWIVGALYVLTARDFRDDDSTLAQIAAVVLGVVQGAALAWRRQRPELVMAVVVATGVPYHLIVADLGIPFAGLIAVWTLALNRPPRVSLVGLAGVLALGAVNFVTTDGRGRRVHDGRRDRRVGARRGRPQSAHRHPGGGATRW